VAFSIAFVFGIACAVRDILIAPKGFGVSVACRNVCHLLLLVLAVSIFTECLSSFICYSQRTLGLYNVVSLTAESPLSAVFLFDAQENCTFRHFQESDVRYGRVWCLRDGASVMHPLAGRNFDPFAAVKNSPTFSELCHN